MATEKELIYGGESYEGEVLDPETGLSRFASLSYYRNKITEFQQHLNALAQQKIAMENLLAATTDPNAAAEIRAWLDDLESNRFALLATAEAVNVAAEGANALGVRMPVPSVPQTLQALPPLALAAIAGAVAGTAWAISYAIDKGTEALAISRRMSVIESLPENERAAALAAEQQIKQAQAQGGLAGVINLLKWGAILVAGYFALQAWQNR